MFNLDRFFQRIQDFAVLYGLKIVVAIIILLVGLWLIRRIVRLAHNLMVREHVDPSLRPFLENVLRIVLTILLAIVVVTQVGLEVTSILAVLGSAGLAVGLALQGSLSNFAGGVLLLTVKPFKVGDFIEAQGQKGTVKQINIFNTVITTEDNKTIFMPNGPLASAVVVNYDVETTRRLELTFTIDASIPLSKVKDVIHRVIDADDRILKDPHHTIGVDKLAAQSVSLYVRVWVQRERGYSRSTVYEDLNEALKAAFEKEQIVLK